VFVFEYRLTKYGWADARIADDESEYGYLAASYLSDALAALLDAVALTVEGAEEARCSWDDEPGEQRFVLRRDGDFLVLRILRFDAIGRFANEDQEPDGDGRCVFESRQPVRVVGRVILEAAESVLAEWGDDGYLEQWGEHPFPLSGLERLRRAVAR
jgi:hypothetical protein